MVDAFKLFHEETVVEGGDDDEYNEDDKEGEPWIDDGFEGVDLVEGELLGDLFEDRSEVGLVLEVGHFEDVLFTSFQDGRLFNGIDQIFPGIR